MKVVGLSFIDGYPQNLEAVATLLVQAQTAELGWGGAQSARAVTVLLVRNPDNEHDENAVEVHVPTLGWKRSMVGHLPRDMAARLAPSLDRGDEWRAQVAAVLVNPEHPDRPGLEVRLERVAVVAA